MKRQRLRIDIGFDMRRMCLVLRFLIPAFLALPSVCNSAPLMLIPCVAFNGAPIETGVTVRVAQPEGWVTVPIGDGTYQGPSCLAVYSPKPEPASSVIELEIVTNIRPKTQDKELPSPEDPVGTRVVGNMRPAGRIRSVRKIGSFDGKQNGRLVLWLVHGDQYDVYITKVISGNAWVDLSLRCDDPKLLKQYLGVLKEEARSVQIIRRPTAA